MSPDGFANFLLEHEIPADIAKMFEEATTPEEVSKIITDHESRIARPDEDGYMGCDEAAELMSSVLRSKGIAHDVVWDYVGNDRQSHTYIRIENQRYDPTNQGVGTTATEKLSVSYGADGQISRRA
jgi:hypothetical protein